METTLTFKGVFLDTKSKGTAHWVAVWKTANGGFIHDRIAGLDVGNHQDKQTAEAFARTHVPSWR